MAGIPDNGFESRNQLERWLKGLPENSVVSFSGMIAHRAALRSLPFVARSFSAKFEDKSISSTLMLAAFRANAVSRVALSGFARKYSHRELDHAADAAASAAYAAANATSLAYSTGMFTSGEYAGDAPSDAARAAARAAAAYATYAATNAADAAEYAVNTAERAYAADAAFWAAITDDARLMQRLENSLVLLSSNLWLTGSPEFWRIENRKFQFMLANTANGEDSYPDQWTVWIEWFTSAVAATNSFGLPERTAEELCIRIALGDGRKVFWEREAKEVNSEISNWLFEARAKVRPQNSETEMQAFIQRPAAHQFYQAGDKIAATALASALPHKQVARDLWQETRAKAAWTRERLALTQVPEHVLNTIIRLHEAFGERIEDVRPGILLMRSRSLEADVATLSTPDARDQLFTDALSLISDLSESLVDFRGVFPEILEIEAARLAQQMAEKSAVETFDLARQVFLVASMSNLVDDSSNAALSLAHIEIAEAQLVIRESQSEHVRAEAIKSQARLVSLHLLDIRNFSAASLKFAGSSVRKAGKDFGKRVYKGALDGAEESAKAGVKAAAVVLAANLAGPLAGLAMLVASFNPLARRAKEIEQENISEAADDDEPIEV